MSFLFYTYNTLRVKHEYYGHVFETRCFIQVHLSELEVAAAPCRVFTRGQTQVCCHQIFLSSMHECTLAVTAWATTDGEIILLPKQPKAC